MICHLGSSRKLRAQIITLKIWPYIVILIFRDNIRISEETLKNGRHHRSNGPGQQSQKETIGRQVILIIEQCPIGPALSPSILFSPDGDRLICHLQESRLIQTIPLSTGRRMLAQTNVCMTCLPLILASTPENITSM